MMKQTALYVVYPTMKISKMRCFMLPTLGRRKAYLFMKMLLLLSQNPTKHAMFMLQLIQLGIGHHAFPEAQLLRFTIYIARRY